MSDNGEAARFAEMMAARLTLAVGPREAVKLLLVEAVRLGGRAGIDPDEFEAVAADAERIARGRPA